MARKRNTPPKKRRSRKDWPLEPPRNVFPRGGHLYMPPQECTMSHCIVEEEDGSRWIPNTVCEFRCKKMCGRAEAYRKTWRGKR